ncbi:MAG TPA: histidine phosphatase family protein [Anaerolineales bacterium]|nr:histidine phosphatase family protein [Anaerolineales bacterium]
MTIYIIRHAHKEQGDFYNPHLRHQDQPISQLGRQESLKLWSYLCDQAISAIYVSAYLRTGQTIEYVAGQLGITPVMDERLNEIDNGLLDNLSEQEVQEKYPDFWKAYRARTADFRFPGGETGEEACRRIAGFLEEKRLVHSNENIVVVSHEGLIRQLTCYILNLPVYKRGNFYIDFCGIMEITYQPDYQSWKLIRFNQKL